MSDLVPKVADRDRRWSAEDFRTEAFRRDALAREKAEEETKTDRGVNLRRLAEQLERRPMDEIAALIRALTYGEMIEFAEGLWATQPEGSVISKDNLPSLLHRWATSLKPKPAAAPADAEAG
jgi:hypothetical protein